MIEESSKRQKHILGSVLYSYNDYDVLYGFLGYSNLLTLLEFILNIREKNIFFIGTAGSLNPSLDKPEILSVNRIYPGSIFRYFSEDQYLVLKKSGTAGVRTGRGISIDLIQREDLHWYKEMRKRDLDFVEMELYPLRWYLGKKFNAMVILSDQITESGIRIFDRKKIKEKFINGFEMIKLEMK
ncbi:MAG: hypothetical protein ABFR36_08515 [Acidobacteriota bacterium]